MQYRKKFFPLLFVHDGGSKFSGRLLLWPGRTFNVIPIGTIGDTFGERPDNTRIPFPDGLQITAL